MKTYLILILCILVSPISANEGLPYKEVYKAIRLLKPREIEGVKYVPFYINPTKKVDLNKANFKIVSPDGKVKKLLVEKLNEIPIKQLEHDDLDAIEAGFVLRIWLPKNIEKYTAWFLNHDFEKGSFTLMFSRSIIRSESIEDRRKEYKENTEEDGNPAQ